MARFLLYIYYIYLYLFVCLFIVKLGKGKKEEI